VRAFIRANFSLKGALMSVVFVCIVALVGYCFGSLSASVTAAIWAGPHFKIMERVMAPYLSEEVEKFIKKLGMVNEGPRARP